MDNRLIKIIANQAEIILEQAKNSQNKSLRIRDTERKLSYAELVTKINVLIRQHDSIVDKVNRLFKEESIDENLEKINEIKAKWDEIYAGTVYPIEGKLLRLIFGAGKILCFLREGIVLPEQTIDRLSSLTTELEEIKNKISSDLYNNLKEAKDDFERGGFLGCSLISGRVIRVCLDKIPGKDINERVDYLRNKNLIRDKDGKHIILKADHFGRNVTSHDLSEFPTSSESLAFLAEAIRISKIIIDINEGQEEVFIKEEANINKD